MRAILPILLSFLAFAAHAKEWKHDIYHCAANIPDSPGWQMIDAPSTPGIAPVLTMQNAARQTVFGINVVEKYHDTNLANPAIQTELEAMLQQFGYQFVGHANVDVGGKKWLQYAVRTGAGPQQVSGLIRYASMGGYVFSISMLRRGGPDAAQDSELQQAAASFRILPPGSFAANGSAAPAPQAGTTGTAARNAAATKSAAGIEPPAAEGETATEEDNSRARMIWAGAAGLVVLVLFLSIIAKKPSR